MQRFRRRSEAEAVFYALSLLPRGIRRFLSAAEFVTEYEPRYLGLHYLLAAEDGRPFNVTSHCTLTHHQPHLPRCRRRPTIVLLSGHAYHPEIVIHELGHVLDEALDFDRPEIEPLSNYAARNRWEAFAVAFQAWSNPTRFIDESRFIRNRDRLEEVDAHAAWFFDSLAAG